MVVTDSSVKGGDSTPTSATTWASLRLLFRLLFRLPFRLLPIRPSQGSSRLSLTLVLLATLSGRVLTVAPGGPSKVPLPWPWEPGLSGRSACRGVLSL